METTNPSPASPGYMVLPVAIPGQRTASVTGVVKFKLPWPCKLIAAGATARASGGTTPTLAVDVKRGGTSILSSPMSITAGQITDGMVSDPAPADESEITIDLAVGGETPTWDDITVLLALKRL